MRIETPLGPAWATVENGALTAFGFGLVDAGHSTSPQVVRQIEEYFAGTRRTFDLPLAPRGSDFQKKVWAELSRIPFGKTITYAELAERIGQPGAFRAVGRANATNRIALIVPCHRVIGSDGTLTGYAFGIDIKQRLLAWEHAVIAGKSNRSGPAS